MKTIITATLLLLLSSALFSQQIKSTDPYESFVVLYTIGKNWDTTKQSHEQLFFSEHSTHLAELRKKGVIAVGGRYSDYGMLIIKAKNEEEAQNLVRNDVAIQHKLFEVEIFPIYIFYKGCIE